MYQTQIILKLFQTFFDFCVIVTATSVLLSCLKAQDLTTTFLLIITTE